MIDRLKAKKPVKPENPKEPTTKEVEKNIEIEELNKSIELYSTIGAEGLRQNLLYFLQSIDYSHKNQLVKQYSFD